MESCRKLARSYLNAHPELGGWRISTALFDEWFTHPVAERLRAAMVARRKKEAEENQAVQIEEEKGEKKEAIPLSVPVVAGETMGASGTNDVAAVPPTPTMPTPSKRKRSNADIAEGGVGKKDRTTDVAAEAAATMMGMAATISATTSAAGTDQPATKGSSADAIVIMDDAPAIKDAAEDVKRGEDVDILELSDNHNEEEEDPSSSTSNSNEDNHTATTPAEEVEVVEKPASAEGGEKKERHGNNDGSERRRPVVLGEHGRRDD